MVFVLVLLLALVNPFKILFAQNLETILDKIQYFYKNIQTIQADFFQETTFSDKSKEIRSGKLWIKNPGNFRWEYQTPEKFLIISDGKKFFVYYPEEKEVLIYPSRKLISSQLALEFMNGRGDIKKDLKLETYKILDKKTWEISFLPLTQDNYVEKLVLIVNIETGEVKEFHFINTLGEKTRILFKNLKYNIKLDNKLFTFIPPKDLKILNFSSEN